MNNVMDIVDYFLFVSNDYEENISNLKLQKLLYYAQGFHLALFDSPLFEDEIRAWMHGPVCPRVYHRYRENGKNPIPYDGSKSFTETLTDEKLDFLDEIYDVFGQYSAWKLRNMTHEEPTWINNENTVAEITQSEMKDYFLTRVK